MATSTLVLISGNAPAPALPAPAEEPTPPPVHLMSLFELTQELEAFENTIDMVPDADRKQFMQRFQGAYTATAAKLDRTQHVRAMLESQIAGTKSEVQRMQDRSAALQRHLDRMDANLVFVIKSRDPDAKGKYRPLQGTTVAFGANRCPPSAQITDEALVPSSFKNATVTLPLELWEELLDALVIEKAANVAEAVRRPDITVRIADIKAALQAENKVPGAKLLDTKYRLVVK
jgi:hypothetical protein